MKIKEDFNTFGLSEIQIAKKMKYEYTKDLEKWMRNQPASYWKGNLEYQKYQNMINLIVVEQRLFGYEN